MIPTNIPFDMAPKTCDRMATDPNNPENHIVQTYCKTFKTYYVYHIHNDEKYGWDWTCAEYKNEAEVQAIFFTLKKQLGWNTK